MHVKIEKARLVPMLRRASACTQERSTHASFAMVRLTAENGHLIVRATDKMLQYETRAKVAQKKPGQIFVNARDALQRTEGMPDGELVLETTNGGQLALRHMVHKRSYILPTGTGEGVTELKWGDDCPTLIETTGATLASLIAAVSWIASTQDTDVEHNAVRFVLDAARVRAEVTSRNGAARIAMDYPGPHTAEIPLSLRGANEIADLARSMGENPVLFSAGERMAFLRAGDELLGVAMPVAAPSQLEGWLKMMASTESVEIVVPRAALYDSVKALRLATTQTNLYLHVVFVPGEVHLLAEGNGNGADSIPTASPIDAPSTYAFSAPDLLDVIKATTGDSFSFSFYPKATHFPFVFAEKRSWAETTVIMQPLKAVETPAVTALLRSGT